MTLRKIFTVVALAIHPLLLFSGSEVAAQATIEIQGRAEPGVRLLRDAGIRVTAVSGQVAILPDLKIHIDELNSILVVSPTVGPALGPTPISTQFRWTISRDGKPLALDSDYIRLTETNPKKVPGDKIVLCKGTAGSTVTLRLDASFLFGVKKLVPIEGVPREVLIDGEVKDADPVVLTFTVGGAQPPAPVPAPTLPAGQYKLAGFTYATLRNDGGLTAQEMGEVALAFSTAYRGVIDQVRTQNTALFDTTLVAFNAAARSAVSTLSIDPARLQPFRTALEEKIVALIETDGAVDTTAELVQVFSEIVDGLNAAAGPGAKRARP